MVKETLIWFNQIQNFNNFYPYYMGENWDSKYLNKLPPIQDLVSDRTKKTGKIKMAMLWATLWPVWWVREKLKIKRFTGVI